MAVKLDHTRAGRRSGPAKAPIRCVIVGCGGHGRVVLDVIRNEGRFEPTCFVDSDRAIHGRHVDGIPVVGTVDDLPAIRASEGIEHAIVAIGHNGVRRKFAERIESFGFELIRAVHPSANVALNATLGRNVVVAAGALVCAHVQIGDSVILNTGSIVDHESMIGTGSHICPGARIAGRVVIGSGAFVGIGSTIIQSLRVGHESVVGAGAVVIRDVAPLSTVVGVPAREVHRIETHGEPQSWLVRESTQLIEDSCVSGVTAGGQNDPAQAAAQE